MGKDIGLGGGGDGGPQGGGGGGWWPSVHTPTMGSQW